MRPTDYARLGALAAIWGAAFIFMRVAGRKALGLACGVAGVVLVARPPRSPAGADPGRHDPGHARIE